MTRKDYELIAEAFKIANGSITVAPYDAETAIALVATVLADSLKRDNAQFNNRRFLEACGVAS